MLLLYLTSGFLLLFVVTDDGSHLFKQTLSSYKDSIAEGTTANRTEQAQEYLKFALIYNVPYLAPSITHACMFGQLLANKHAAPTTIKNYISGARTWIEEHGGNNSAFQSRQFAQIIKGFVKNSSHIPRQAAPLTARHIQLICHFLDSSSQASLAIKPAILIGFLCFLRASNLFTSTMSAWAGPHSLLVGDIRLDQHELLVVIRSTKTRTRSQPLVFKIPKGRNERFCPWLAWKHYYSTIRPYAFGPAFLHSNGLPVTGRQVTAVMRLALSQETDIDSTRVSLHSLRRGATQTSIDLGVPLESIKTRGTWASDSGMKPYLPSQFNKVPTVPVINLPD